MHLKNRNYLSLILWVVFLISFGSLIGSMTKSEINTWYSLLNRSILTPPAYVFPIAWTILYAMIGFVAWLIWSQSDFPKLGFIKGLFLIQLILNWSWTPVFFHYHLIACALIILFFMDVFLVLLMVFSFSRIKAACLLMLPYLIWIIFATYLNFYIWQNN